MELKIALWFSAARALLYRAYVCMWNVCGQTIGDWAVCGVIKSKLEFEYMLVYIIYMSTYAGTICTSFAGQRVIGRLTANFKCVSCHDGNIYVLYTYTNINNAYTLSLCWRHIVEYPLNKCVPQCDWATLFECGDKYSLSTDLRISGLL